MGKTTRAASAVVAMLALYVTACVDPQEVTEMKSRVDEIQAQQKDVLAKLDTLAKGQKQILAKAPAAAARPSKPAEDPNKVYEIPVGNSYVKGAKDASVTIVEFSDFQ